MCAAAMYLASGVDGASVVCFFKLQATGDDITANGLSIQI